jgi:hypothetical protein
VRGVFRVIILLKDEVYPVQPIKLQFPGVHLEECWHTAQHPFSHLSCTYTPLLEVSCSPKPSGIHPQILLSRCFSPDPGFCHTQDLPSDPNLLILVSSDQITLLQSSRVQCWCSRASSSHLLWEPLKERAFSASQQP